MELEPRDAFIFYRSFYEAFEDLPDDVQLKLYQAIASYSFTLVEPKLEGISKTIFKLIKPQIEANNKRYLNGKKAKQKQELSEEEAKRKQELSEEEARKEQNGNKEGTKEKEKEKENANVKEKDLSIYLNGFNSVLNLKARMTDERRKKLKLFAKKFNINEFEEGMHKVNKSDFLQKEWTGWSFDWFIKEANFVKLIEGAYDNKKQNNGGTHGKFEEQDFDKGMEGFGRV